MVHKTTNCGKATRIAATTCLHTATATVRAAASAYELQSCLPFTRLHSMKSSEYAASGRAQPSSIAVASAPFWLAAFSASTCDVMGKGGRTQPSHATCHQCVCTFQCCPSSFNSSD